MAILWIQQHVLSGDVFLQQLPTAWNVADLCMKALPQQRVKVLLYDLGVCKDNGLTIIGQLTNESKGMAQEGKLCSWQRV